MNTGKVLPAGWVEGDYGDFLELSMEERAIVEARLERSRLEREVITAAKNWLAECERINATTYSTENKIIATLDNNLALAVIVKPLIDFESKQETK